MKIFYNIIYIILFIMHGSILPIILIKTDCNRAIGGYTSEICK